MARAFTAKAAKDYPQHGIKKGDVYYYWSVGFRGRKQMSKTPPRPSQLCGSKMSGALAASEAMQDAINDATCIEDITSAMESAIEEIRSVASEYEDASQAETGNGNRVPNADEMEEKAQGLNDWADSIESDKDEVESMSASDYVDEDVAVEDLDDDLVEEVDGEKKRKDVSDFDDLTDDEQSNMLDAAKEAAQQNVDCPV